MKKRGGVVLLKTIMRFNTLLYDGYTPCGQDSLMGNIYVNYFTRAVTNIPHHRQVKDQYKNM